MSDLDDAIERLNPDASPQYLYRGPSNTADVEDDLRLVIAAARERDALAAVIEEARAWAVGHRAGVGGFDCVQARDVDAILSRTPAAALVGRDARIRAEVIDWMEEDAPVTYDLDAAREHFGLTKGAHRG